VKVLVAHNRYRSDVPSGENRVVDGEIEALLAHGVEVVPYLRSSDEIGDMSLGQRLAVPVQPIHGRRAIMAIEGLIERHRPELVHLHNPYPLISLSVVRAAHRHGLPIVQTVHNHRHSCMRGSYFRDGHPCQQCRGKALPWPAVQHGCYRDSHVQSVPMAVAFLAHRREQRDVDRYIALTDSVATSLLESGLVEADQVTVRPNFVPDPGPPGPPGSGLLFVGRLTREKGIRLLLRAWERAGAPFGTLTVIGEGPERSLVEAAAGNGVRLLGQRGSTEVAAAFRAAAALVVPSTSPEGLPLVVLEAFAHARPVLATSGGGLAAAVDSTVGWLAEPTTTALATLLREAAGADLAILGASARSRYEQRFSPDIVVARQLEIYRQVIASPRSR
jgi:glycosyltransferase involved in cell wall biosynthesis